MVAFCPHELFINTKSDLGPCRYLVHNDEKLKKAFKEQSHPDEREDYERDFMDYLTYLIGDLDKKTRRAQDRLRKPAVAAFEPLIDPTLKDELDEKCILTMVEVESLLQDIEQNCKAGNVMAALQLEPALDVALEEHKKAFSMANPFKNQEKEMQVCDICGSFLVVNEDLRRLETHYEGRQHSGFEKIRKELDSLKVIVPILV